MSKTTLFKNFVLLQRGFDLPNPNRKSGTIPVVASTGISGYHNEHKVNAPGVVTGRSGSLGTVQYITDNFWPLNTSLWVKDFKGNSPRYVYYYLQTMRLENYNSGAGVPTLNRNDLDVVEVDIHEQQDQHKIISILSAYDNLIENNDCRIAILEEMAQKLYREWFVHFRFPGHENVKMVESEMGLIPEGWTVDCLERILDYSRGKSYTSQELDGESTVPFVNLKNMKSYGGFREDGTKSFAGTYKASHVIKNGDIILAVTDMTQERRLVGQVARISNIPDFAVITMDLVKLNPYDKQIREYVYAMFRFSGIASRIATYANGANVLHLNPEIIKQQMCIIPSDKIMVLFSVKCVSIFDFMDKLNAKNVNLRKTRDLLLPRLISGDIDVSDLDIPVKEV